MAHEISNMRVLGHNTLAGFGNIGEGMAIQQAPDGRRIMWLAHESLKNFTGVDVSDPREPTVVVQTDLLHQEMRSNSLAVVGDLMYVAYQVAKPGLPGPGMGVYDISRPESPRRIGFFDVSGPDALGVHCLWCVDGQYAHLKSSMPDAKPRNPKDDQFYVIADISDPTKPEAVGRWWIPGTMEGDSEPPPERHPKFDAGFDPHNVNVYPQRPDRAYGAFKDGGVVILDISDVAHPKQVSWLDYHPPLIGYTHTVVPLFERGLMVVTEESVRRNGADWPKLTWVMDMSVETNVVPLASMPMPDTGDFFNRPGRFGSHNVHENQPVPTSFTSEELVFGTYFSGGLRVHDISNPFEPKEVASFIPEPVPTSEAMQAYSGALLEGVNLNDVYVDENRLVYTVDRVRGGLYILELTI